MSGKPSASPRTYRATLAPIPLPVQAVEPDPKRQGRLKKVIERHLLATPSPKGRTPEAVDMMGLLVAVHALYGCLTRPMVEFLCRATELYTGQVYAAASFYADIYLDPKGRHYVKVCTGTACHVKGAPRLAGTCARALGVKATGDTDADGEFTFFTTACVGACSLAPVLMLDSDIYGNPELAAVPDLIASHRQRGVGEKGQP
ncbi:MAG: NAD(P)H-dependent oxidoreductase subunit E [Nitrospirota bacterium]|nr:NAD(P)H-dependent oxidoreductase subunit E [Nitrospirota bacterium]